MISISDVHVHVFVITFASLHGLGGVSVLFHDVSRLRRTLGDELAKALAKSSGAFGPMAEPMMLPAYIFVTVPSP